MFPIILIHNSLNQKKSQDRFDFYFFRLTNIYLRILALNIKAKSFNLEKRQKHSQQIYFGILKQKLVLKVPMLNVSISDQIIIIIGIKKYWYKQDKWYLQYNKFIT
ncbi:hypothetical protein BpHYR1_000741 [Brachionus plicatilis]|uniref:Uncharacterized protein n=1 Tax=Brachionus plicatilis TaxID=10195 RepID=A0A3M7S2Z1_BRAPC|nr:hypothetical protein BpHYR1_000741 [Brachionus plicatilis]